LAASTGNLESTLITSVNERVHAFLSSTCTPTSPLLIRVLHAFLSSDVHSRSIASHQSTARLSFVGRASSASIASHQSTARLSFVGRAFSASFTSDWATATATFREISYKSLRHFFAKIPLSLIPNWASFELEFEHELSLWAPPPQVQINHPSSGRFFQHCKQSPCP
jgi:hypothetical protein